MVSTLSPVAASSRDDRHRHNLPIAPILLQQEFVAQAPNRVWLADISSIATAEGWLYLAAVLDLATRKIVGWSMRDHMRKELPKTSSFIPTAAADTHRRHTASNSLRLKPNHR